MEKEMMDTDAGSGISLVIPVGNGSPYLPHVFRALNAQTRRPDQILIVNDRVRDNSLACVDLLDMPFRIVASRPDRGRYGAAAARNIGAEYSKGSLLVFLDADVILPADYLEALSRKFENARRSGETVDAVVGISGTDCTFRDFFSNYKNLWMRFTYQRLRGFVGTVNTSCFAVRREAFFGSGGFDEFRRRDVEDAVYGDKLYKQGYRVVVDNDLEYVHKKKYGLLSAIRVDMFRSRKLTEYSLSVLMNKESNPRSSIPRSYFFGIPLCCAALALLPVAFLNRYVLFISLFLLALSSALSLEFLSYVGKIKGRLFALKAFFYQLVVFASSGVGIAAGLVTSLAAGRSRRGA